MTFSDKDGDIKISYIRLSECKVVCSKQQEFKEFSKIWGNQTMKLLITILLNIAESLTLKEEDIWGAISEEIIQENNTNFLIQYGCTLVKVDGKLQITGINRDGVCHYLYNLPDIVKIVKSKAFFISNIK